MRCALLFILCALRVNAQFDYTDQPFLAQAQVPPESLPVENALAWWNPSSLAWTNNTETTLATATGDRVGKWQDRTTNGTHAYLRLANIGGFDSRFQITNSVAGSYRAINSKSGSSYTPGQLFTFTNIVGVTSVTVFAVAQFRVAGSPGFGELVSLGGVDSLDGSILFRENGINNGMNLYTDGTEISSSSGLVDQQYYVFSYRFDTDADTVQIWTNGVTHASGSVAASVALADPLSISIGYRPASADSTDLHWGSDILEVAVFGFGLTDGQVSLMNNFLLNKYSSILP